MKEYKTSKKTYMIDERGVVYDKQTMEPTKDIQIRNEHYFLAGKPLHRIIYELYKGHIPPKHCIHHQNTCPRDNRLSNLILLTCSEHGKLHSEIGRQGFEKQLKSKAVQFFYREYKTVCKAQKREQIYVGRHIRRHIRKSPQKRHYTRKAVKKYSVNGSCEYHYQFTEKELRLIQAFNKANGN